MLTQGSGPEQSRDGVSEATHQGCGYGEGQEVPWALLQALTAQLPDPPSLPQPSRSAEQASRTELRAVPVSQNGLPQWEWMPRTAAHQSLTILQMPGCHHPVPPMYKEKQAQHGQEGGSLWPMSCSQELVSQTGNGDPPQGWHLQYQ